MPRGCELQDPRAYENPHYVQFVSGWFMTQKLIKIWDDDDSYCNADDLAEWYNGYKKRKALKTTDR